MNTSRCKWTFRETAIIDQTMCFRLVRYHASRSLHWQEAVD